MIKKFEESPQSESIVCLTGRYREMLQQVISVIDINTHDNPDIMKHVVNPYGDEHASKRIFDIIKKYLIQVGKIMLRAFRRLGMITKTVYDSRMLLLSLALKDFKRRFAGSYFGTVWAFIQPLITIMVYWVAFQYGFRAGNLGSTPFILWFTAGIVPWLFMSEAISSASNSLLEYSYLVKKVIFNIDILPLVKIISSLFIHLFFVTLVLVICCFMGYWPTLHIIQLLYYFLCAVIFVFGLTLLTSALMAFFRDLGQIINIVLLIGMWSTPLFWDISIVPEQYQFIVKLNPFFYIVQGYRETFTEGIWFWEKYNQTSYFWIVTILLLLVGSVVFNRLKPHLSDVL